MILCISSLFLQPNLTGCFLTENEVVQGRVSGPSPPAGRLSLKAPVQSEGKQEVTVSSWTLTYVWPQSNFFSVLHPDSLWPKSHWSLYQLISRFRRNWSHLGHASRAVLISDKYFCYSQVFIGSDLVLLTGKPTPSDLGMRVAQEAEDIKCCVGGTFGADKLKGHLRQWSPCLLCSTFPSFVGSLDQCFLSSISFTHEVAPLPPHPCGPVMPHTLPVLRNCWSPALDLEGDQTSSSQMNQQLPFLCLWLTENNFCLLFMFLFNKHAFHIMVEVRAVQLRSKHH